MRQIRCLLETERDKNLCQLPKNAETEAAGQAAASRTFARMGLLLRIDRPQWLRKSPWIIRRQMIYVQDKLVIEDDIQHGAARQFRFRTACE